MRRGWGAILVSTVSRGEVENSNHFSGPLLVIVTVVSNDSLLPKSHFTLLDRYILTVTLKKGASLEPASNFNLKLDWLLSLKILLLLIILLNYSKMFVFISKSLWFIWLTQFWLNFRAPSTWTFAPPRFTATLLSPHFAPLPYLNIHYYHLYYLWIIIAMFIFTFAATWLQVISYQPWQFWILIVHLKFVAARGLISGPYRSPKSLNSLPPISNPITKA